MLIIKILYVLALAVSGGLILLSDKYQFMALFVLLLIFPILSIIDIILTAPFVRVKGKISATVIDEKTENRLNLRVWSILPVFNGIFVLSLKNNLTGKTSKQKIHFSTLPFINKKIALKPYTDHCGVLEIAVEKLVIQDLFRLFKLVRRPKNLVFKQYILPKRIPLDLNIYLRQANISLDEDKFSEEKSGDDVSEIFGIREYREGDRYRQIHWKLSAKRDILISKEYSLPIDKEVTIVCSPFFDSLENTEGFYDKVYSLSRELIENNIKHTIIFRTKSNMIPAVVSEEKDLTSMACVLVSLKPVVAEREPHGTLYIDGRS